MVAVILVNLDFEIVSSWRRSPSPPVVPFAASTVASLALRSVLGPFRAERWRSAIIDSSAPADGGSPWAETKCRSLVEA